MTPGHGRSVAERLLAEGGDTGDADHLEVDSSSSAVRSGLPESSVGSNDDESKTARCSLRVMSVMFFDGNEWLLTLERLVDEVMTHSETLRDCSCVLMNANRSRF